MRLINIVPIVLLFILMMLGLPLFGQVEQPVQEHQDTVYLYEEEVVYDTLYVYDSIAPQKMMTKDALIAAFRADRGEGTLKYQKRHFYLSAADSLVKLDNADLKKLFSPSDYADYENARRNSLKSIPMWIFGIGAVGVSAWGLYEMSMNAYSAWFTTSPPSALAELGLKRPTTVGFIIFVAGTGAATVLLRYAKVYTNGSKDTCLRLARRFRSGGNVSYAPPSYTVGPTASGFGITFDF